MTHCYKQGGLNIVIDCASGSIHVTDDPAFDMISLFEGYERRALIDMLEEKYADDPSVSREELETCYEELTELRELGQLFSDDHYTETAARIMNGEGVPADCGDEECASGSFPDKERCARGFTSGGNIVKALCLHVAHTCNLNCAYCFASQGRYSGERALMSFETGRRALDFLIENSGTRRHLEVDFFGGEPLMNFAVVQDLVRYARKVEHDAGKEFRFTLTTNGMLIDDEVIDFANREMSNVVLSLDGRREIHDRYRVDYRGEGSFDRIVPLFQKLVEARGGRNYYMRGTFTHQNPDFLNDIRAMLDLGFREISMEPVVCAPFDPARLTEEDLGIVMHQYEELAELMLDYEAAGDPFTFYHYMLDLENGPCIYKRIMGCGSGSEYMAVTPWGDLYPCHQFVGETNMKLGDIWHGVSNTSLRDEFRHCNIFSHPECADCWARLYCAGGCAANAYHASGSVTGIYADGCKLFKKRMECAIYLEARRKLGPMKL